jgi:hypothetical protein
VRQFLAEFEQALGSVHEGFVTAEKCVEIAQRIKMAPGEEEKLIQALIDPESA